MDESEVAESIFKSVHGYVAPAIKELESRLAIVNKRIDEIPAGPSGDPGAKGEDGKSITADDVAPLIKDEVTKAVEAIPRPEVDYERVGGLVKEFVSLVPPGKDGIDGKNGSDGKDADAEAITKDVLVKVSEVLDAIQIPKDGQNGKDADPEMVRAAVAEELAKQEDAFDLFSKALLAKFAQVEHAD